ncbi:MAG: serine hydrolase domain-containing protein [Rhodanobacter sp.]
MSMKKLLVTAITALTLGISGAFAQTPSSVPVTPNPLATVPSSTMVLPAESLPNGTHALSTVDVNAWLDGYMPYALATAGVPGAVVVVVKDGQILTERGFGYADVAEHTPVDPKLTLFRPGSVSKLFTWTAVMQLVEQGKIDLDGDINQYLDFKIPARDGKPITMRNLMQHTAGFEEQAKGTISNDPQASRMEAILKQWVPHRVFAAGSTPAYSNYGASLAGYIVQRVSGESFDDYMDKHIFAPLEMKHSSFRQPLPADLAPLMAKGYKFEDPKPQPFEFIGPAPAGALASTGEDMAHFMIAHLQGGEYDGHRILSAQTAAQMHNSPLTVLPPLNRMELGFFETNINGREVIAHLGDTALFHTSLHLFLKQGVGFYVSFNSAGKAGAVGGLRGAMFRDFADRYFPARKSDDARVDAATAEKHARMLVGHWDNSRTSKSTFLAVLDLIGQTKVSLNAQGGLVLPFKNLGGLPLQWVEVSPFVWHAVNSHERLAAKVVDGKAVRFSIDEVSPFMVFDRTPATQNAAWLMPLLIASLLALVLTALLWPVNAIVRRCYRAPLQLAPRAMRGYRLSKIAALLIVAALLAWLLTFQSMMSNLNNFGASFDSVIHASQVFGIIAFIGGWLAVLVNLYAVWSTPRRWPARVWSVALVISASTVLWVAVVFHLISLSTNY